MLELLCANVMLVYGASYNELTLTYLSRRFVTVSKGLPQKSDALCFRV